jgi:hypothetical protein
VKIKGKVALVPKHHNMKSYGDREVSVMQPRPRHETEVMVSYLRGLMIPIQWKDVWTPEPVWVWWEMRKFMKIPSAIEPIINFTLFYCTNQSSPSGTF